MSLIDIITVPAQSIGSSERLSLLKMTGETVKELPSANRVVMIKTNKLKHCPLSFSKIRVNLLLYFKVCYL